MRINQNIAALNSYRNLVNTNSGLSKSLERLSSGLRINRAADDAAGLAISEKMRGQIRGLNQASANAQDSISLLQTAEGALNETHSILQRVRELAVQASNDTLTSSDRSSISDEIDQLKDEIDRIRNSTEFNTKTLLNGGLSKAYTASKATILQNTALKDSGGAAIVLTDKLVNLTDTNGNSLGLANGDTITISGRMGSSQVSGTLTVSAATTISALKDAIETVFATSTAGVVISAGTMLITGDAGLSQAIGAFTITAADSSSGERTAFNNALGSTTQTQTAADAKSDTTATIHIGANQNQTMSVDINDMGTTALGVGAVSVSSQTAAEISINVLDEAIATVSTERSKLGALQNRLNSTINNLGVASENLTAAESRVRDLDMAKEMMTFTRSQILLQAGTAMLAQANQVPSSVLQLLG